MGLHHRFPSYFYKSGNLFNTYLGYTERPERQPSRDELGRHRDKRRSPATTTQPRRASPGVERLTRFVKNHLALEDAERLLLLLARDAGIELDLTQSHAWSIPMKLVYFAEQHLSNEQAQTYAEVLEHRLAAGEPLIQK